MHAAEDVLTAVVSLSERSLHDFGGDVHLERRDAVFGAGYLEVHVAKVIFVAEDVGEHGEAVTFLDEAHGHTGNVVLKRHAGIEH